MTTTNNIGPWHCPDCKTSPIEAHKEGCMFAPSFEKIEIPTLAKHDPVNHPSHYTEHPSGVECIQVQLSWLGQRNIGTTTAQPVEQVTQVVDLERDSAGKYRIKDPVESPASVGGGMPEAGKDAGEAQGD